MQEFNHTERFKLFTPEVRGHVNHRTEKLEQEIRMLVRLLGKFNIAIHKLFQSFQRIRVELGYIAANFE